MAVTRTVHTTRYIAVLEGEGPGTPRPILATADPEIVSRVIALIRERMTAASSSFEVPSPSGNGRVEA